MQIIVYLIYFVSFTCCYYFVNPKLSTKKIFIGYFSFFWLSMIPVKYWVDYVKPLNNEDFFSMWLKIILMLIAGFCLFNISYGVVNLITSSQEKFHRTYGYPNRNPVKFYLDNQVSIKKCFHLFFYIGATVLMAIAVYQYSLDGK